MLNKPIDIPLEELFLDRNNPRLAPELRNYTDVTFLLDEGAQDGLATNILNELHGLQDLIEVIIQQGWLPVDQIIVWSHPDAPDKPIVVEGNRRTTALKHIHDKELARAKHAHEKWEKIKEDHPERYQEAVDYLKKVNEVIEATKVLNVTPMRAQTHEELMQDLPRILAVRHINSARGWGGYPTDRWLLNQYNRYEKKKTDPDTPWDGDLIKEVANEASIKPRECKKRLRAASLYQDFTATWEDELPEGEEFKDSDYYLFELVSQVAWFRDDVLKLGLDSRRFTDESSKALFEWVFKEARGHRANDNPNKFYRHENIRLLNTIRNYDNDNGTSFTKPFTIEDYQNVPKVEVLEPKYLQHKNQEGSDALLKGLIDALDELKMSEARQRSEYMIAQLQRLKDIVEDSLRMIKASNG